MGPRRCGGPVTPPVVVFALCCAAAGAACLCVGEFVRRVAVRDPDVAQDWNSLLLHLGELDLCVQEQRSDNDTREVTPSPPAPARPARAPPTAPGPGADGPSSSAPPLPPRLLVSVRVLVTLTPSAGSAWGRSGAVSHLGVSLPSQALHLAGPSRPVNVTLSLATTWDSDDCHLRGNCQAASYNACAIVWADSGVLPNTPRPESCDPVDEELRRLEATVAEGTADPGWSRRPGEIGKPSGAGCRGSPVLRVFHTEEPGLSVLLSQERRSEIGLRLSYSAAAMAGSLLLVLVCGALGGRTRGPGRPALTELSPHKMSLSGQ
ncbi:transmembrane protein 248 [Lampetra fluviatilis]